jgi:hypothetical protein
MTKKSVKMTLSDKGLKRFNTAMKKMNFKDPDLFLRYCVLKTIKQKLTESQKEQANREMKLLVDAQKKL